jgi:predicted RNA-binding Zn ribbon-like protein
LEHVARFADAGSGGGLRWSAGRAVLSVQARGAPFDVLAEHLAPATLDLLLSGPPLRTCAGPDCLKTFDVPRADRRWCDSAVCGNRVRVRAHSASQRST